MIDVSADGENLSVLGVTCCTVLACVSLAMRMFSEIVLEVFRERGCISGDLAALKAVPNGDSLLVRFLGGLCGLCGFLRGHEHK